MRRSNRRLPALLLPALVQQGWAGALPMYCADSPIDSVTVAGQSLLLVGAVMLTVLLVRQLVVPDDLQETVNEIARNGGTPLVLARNADIVGVIELQDVLKEGIRERFDRLRTMGLKTVMLTGDNPLTAAYIARQADLHICGRPSA